MVTQAGMQDHKSCFAKLPVSLIDWCHLMALLLELSTFPAGLRNFSYLQPAISARAGVYNAI